VQGVAAQPHHHDPVDDGGVDQQGGGHVRDRPDGQHEQRLIRRRGPRPAYQIQGRVAPDRLPIAAEEGPRSPVDETFRRPAQPVQQAQDLGVAFLHPFRRGRRPLIAERRGIDGLQVDALRRKQGVNQGELVVDLVVGIGIEHGAHPARRRFQAGQAAGHAQRRECRHRDSFTSRS